MLYLFPDLDEVHRTCAGNPWNPLFCSKSPDFVSICLNQPSDRNSFTDSGV